MVLQQLLGPTPLATTPNDLMGGRLTLDAAGKLPVPTADQTAATAIWLVPYVGRSIALWNSTLSSWVIRAIQDAGVSVSLGTLSASTCYDVFAYDNAGSVALELGTAWTTSSGASAARAVALVVSDGVLVKSGDKTRRYLGTFYTQTTSTTEDSAARRYLWNYYNRVSRRMIARDTTSSWTYAVASTFRAADANTTDGQGRFSFVIGVSEDPVEAVHGKLASSASAQNVVAGIALDATNTNHALPFSGFQVPTSALIAFGVGTYKNYPGIGQHFLQAVEWVGTTTAVTFYGAQGGAPLDYGMHGTMWA